MGWIIYAIVILIIGVLVGLHLGRFREAYTEMTGMMAGMTMGMMNGFVLGFAASAAFVSVFRLSNTVSLFWGNIVGIGLGLLLGAYFGRAGGLMGVMDGSMGGVMGGSMGAMLAAMLTFPEELLFWTAIPLSLVYVVSMVALIVLIERSAPGHAALHRLAPYFTRAMAEEAAEQADAASRARMEDFYEFLGIPRNSNDEAINNAYLAKLAVCDTADVHRADRAVAILTDPVKRRAYDSRLAPSDRPDCCPPPRKKTPAAPEKTAVLSGATNKQAVTATRRTRPQPARKRAGIGRGPIIGGLAVLLLAGVFASWQIGLAVGEQSRSQASGAAPNSGIVAKTDGGSTLPPEFVSRLQAQAVDAPVAPDGRQTIDMAIYGDSMSYKPATIRVKQGVPVHINLSIGPGRDPG